jgi:hypothetical protein
VRNRTLAERRSARGRAEHGEPEQHGPEQRLQAARRLILTRLGRRLHQLPVSVQRDDGSHRDEREEGVEGCGDGAGPVGESCRDDQSGGHRSAGHGYIDSTLHRMDPS